MQPALLVGSQQGVALRAVLAGCQRVSVEAPRDEPERERDVLPRQPGLGELGRFLPPEPVAVRLLGRVRDLEDLTSRQPELLADASRRG